MLCIDFLDPRPQRKTLKGLQELTLSSTWFDCVTMDLDIIAWIFMLGAIHDLVIIDCCIVVILVYGICHLFRMDHQLRLNSKADLMGVRRSNSQSAYA